MVMQAMELLRKLDIANFHRHNLMKKINEASN